MSMRANDASRPPVHVVVLAFAAGTDSAIPIRFDRTLAYHRLIVRAKILRVSASPAYRCPSRGSTAQLRALAIDRAIISTVRCERSTGLSRSESSACPMSPMIESEERVLPARRVIHNRSAFHVPQCRAAKSECPRMARMTANSKPFAPLASFAGKQCRRKLRTADASSRPERRWSPGPRS